MVRRNIQKGLRATKRAVRINLNQRLLTLRAHIAYERLEPYGNRELYRTSDARFAVVIHLYYTDNWPLFEKKLQALRKYKYDIFITIPGGNMGFTPRIRKAYPNANIFVVPNLGRDVLPFIKIAQLLRRQGYEWVLKFHSKKSTHRSDGQEWLEEMLNRLLPSDSSVMQRLNEIMSHSDTGIVGPDTVYYPLSINFPANGEAMTWAISKLYSKAKAHEYLQIRRAEYGFFGGTMFWARIDALGRLLDFPIHYFDLEAGQIDATFAHALERLFCVVPEIEGRKLYELTPHTVKPRSYKSDNIPDWSEDHEK